MSELQIETISATDFLRKLTLSGDGEQANKTNLLDRIKPCAFDNKLKFIVYDDSQICGDVKLPSRIVSVPAPKRGEELVAELTEKMSETTLRREKFISSIVQKSRLYNEKIMKAREKMFAKRAEQTQNADKELQGKRCAAQLKREKIFQDKLERIKKHMQYVMAVRNKKTGNVAGKSPVSESNGFSSSDEAAR